jgi:hypothetical protein
MTAACWAPGGAAAEPADIEFFEKKVRPLLVERCHGCHSTQAKKQRGGLHLDSRASILQGGDSGPALVPGRPEQSLLIRAVRYEKDGLHMPPRGKLPLQEVAVLEEWIRRGAPYPGPLPATTRQEGIDLAAGRRFWSFQPLHALPTPAVRDRNWPQQKLDAFILAEMEQRGLAPSPAADRRVLIRRLTFGLTGLPPTPEEVEAFVKDDRPDADVRLVDRLLASPGYGERWARFWLDLARYCDVSESWVTRQGQPWVYRDWVVQALNDDLPYDQFVVKQLAADLLPGGATRDRAALGFLGLSPDYWKELQLDKELIKAVVADEWEERIDTVGRTFLGLTVACARCHDHKFDPISTQDYYALAGVFASIRPADYLVRPEDLRLALTHFRLPALGPMTAVETAAVLRQSALGKVLLARGVEDASLTVEADGPHRTKLSYRPGVGQDIALQIRGNPSNLGPSVPRRFLAVLSPTAPQPFTQGSGRLELARAIVTEGAPLSARVLVNRVWQHHFGRGLVETPSDFGGQGARPSHPQLLDDLAARFVANGWSLKWLHREILLSATYRQASGHDARKHATDPDNRWLWRMNRRRLEVEAWRDAMLMVAGVLRTEHGGTPVDLNDPNNCRRTLYATVKRRDLHDMLRLHDFPDPITHAANRIVTTTPLQQLFTLNSPLLRQQAVALAKRMHAEVPADAEARVRRAYLLLYGRPATDQQVRLALTFLGGDTASQDEPWVQYAHVLLASNEFLFID